MRGVRVKALRRHAAGIRQGMLDELAVRQGGEPTGADSRAVARAYSARQVRRQVERERREKSVSAAVETLRSVDRLGKKWPKLATAAVPQLRVAAGFGRRQFAEKRLAAIRRGAEERADSRELRERVKFMGGGGFAAGVEG